MSLPPDIRESGFECNARDGAAFPAISVNMQGEADFRAKPHLGGFFRAVHAAALEKGTDVHVDLRTVKFMNSSCLQELVQWLSMLSKVPTDAGYKVVFRADVGQHWQRRTLQALIAFAPDRVLIES